MATRTRRFRARVPITVAGTRVAAGEIVELSHSTAFGLAHEALRCGGAAPLELVNQGGLADQVARAKREAIAWWTTMHILASLSTTI